MAKIDLESISYVMGLLSIVLAFFSPFAGLIIGIIGYSQAKKKNFTEARRLNAVGMILSVVVVLLIVVGVIFFGDGGVNSIFP